MEDPATINIPPSTTTVTVKAINVAREGTYAPAAIFIQPVLPGLEMMESPVYAFLIEHISGRRIMFDLGLRKDIDQYPPVIQDRFNGFDIKVGKDVMEQLIAGGVALETIDSVIWSHSHADHTGDMSKFPQSTELIVGPGYDRRTYPSDPEATLLDTDFAGRTVKELSFTKEPTLKIGNLPAIDFFKDGSLYLLDLPGHCPGHIGALARVGENSFVLLGGDACHHPGMLRPNPHITKYFPYPKELLTSTQKTISTKYFPNPDGTTANFDLSARSSPLLSIAEQSVYSDRETSIKTLAEVIRFDAHPDIFLLLAHDASLIDIIDLFPASLNDWKEKGWKVKNVWAFLQKGDRAFRFNELQ